MPSGRRAEAPDERSSDAGELAPLVREALERMVTPETAGSIIELALLRSGAAALPQRSRELADFIRGELFAATACELGRDVAEAQSIAGRQGFPVDGHRQAGAAPALHHEGGMHDRGSRTRVQNPVP